MPESTITWKFKETLTPFTNAQGYKEAVYIHGAMSDANENNIKSIVFDASGVMTYVYANGDSAEIYNNNKTSTYLRGNTYVSYPSDYIVVGAYDAANDVFRDVSGVIIPARTNAIYCDENGLGVYKYNGIYNQLLYDLHDYVIVSIDNKLFVISTPAKADFSQYDNGYSSDHSLRVDIKNILNDVSTQTDTYFLYYVDDVVEGKYTLHFANYYQYTHYMTSDDNERLITLVGDDYVDFYSMNANAKDWLLKNAEFNTEGITFTSKKSLISVANAIRKQVGDYNDEEDEWSQSHQYYYPDAEGTDETFIKKIERLNNTYTHTNNNPASEDNVLEGKSYWRDGEEHIGTMRNWSSDGRNWGTHGITSVEQVVQVPTGYHYAGNSKVKISSTEQPKIISENIKNGITILGVDGKRSVIETNTNDDNNWNDRVAAPANRIVSGYSAYLNGNIIDGTLPRHTDEYESINNKMYPIDSGVNISSTEGLINRELSFIWGQTTNNASFRGELTAYPAETKYYMTFDEVANRNIVSKFDPMRGRIDSKISDNLSKFTNDTYILGYQGTMRSIVTDQKINDVGSVEVDSNASIMHYIIDNGAYFNSDVAIYADYNQIVNAYNSDNLTKNRMIPENIKSGSTLFGVGGKSTVIDTESSLLSEKPIISSAILTGYSGFVNGQEVVGNYNDKSFVDIKSEYKYISGYSYTVLEPVGLSLCVELSLNGTTIEPSGSQYDTNFITDSGSVLKVDLRVVNGTVPFGDAHIKYFDVYINGVPLSVPHYETLAGRITSDSLQHIIASYSYGIPRSCTYQISNVPVDGEENTYALRLDINDAPPFGEKTITENGTYNAIDDGFLGYSKVTVNVAGGGGTDVSDTTALASDVLYDKQFYLANGVKTTGTIQTKTNSDITYGKTTTIPAGYYASQCQNTFSDVVIDISPVLNSSGNYFDDSGFEFTFGAYVTATSAGWASGSLGNDGAVGYIKASNLQNNQTISTKAGTVAVNEGYVGGNYTVGISQAEQDKIIASNIKNGVTILGVTGSYSGGSGINDLTDTSWAFNNSIDISGVLDTSTACERVYDVIFNSMTTALIRHIKLKCDGNGTTEVYYYIDQAGTYIKYYDSVDGWNNVNAKNISFDVSGGAGTDATNTYLIAWLQDNAQIQQ